ncbi:MAG: DUF3375 domain-containing protein [Myxococcota bacterium]
MDHAALDALRKSHPGWRLLTADHAPLVMDFLHRTFIAPNVRTLAQPEITSRLEDHLFHLRSTLGAEVYPRTATAYLEEWASDARGWLRKYYPPRSDEPHYDLTPATEKALEWVFSLRQRQFVGTESRLLTVFHLLRELVEETNTRPEDRLAELERRRAAIDAEIDRVRRGQVDLMDDARVKDRFVQMAATARGLLSDFREVEHNFRVLDRDVRARIAAWEGSKGSLLDDVFGQRDAIADSDEGRSFRAFWDFLMSPSRQEELTTMLATVMALPAVQSLEPDERLLRVHYDWLEAGDMAQRTVARLSEQLRRFLDEQSRMENRRMMQVIRQVEQHALKVREAPPEGVFVELDEASPDVELTMDRPLFSPPLRARITEQALAATSAEIPTDALFNQVYVDRAALEGRIRRALQARRQVSLAELVTDHPLEQGLAELVTYLAIASDDPNAVIDDASTEAVPWRDDAGNTRQATVPLVLFRRNRGKEVAHAAE